MSRLFTNLMLIEFFNLTASWINCIFEFLEVKILAQYIKYFGRVSGLNQMHTKKLEIFLASENTIARKLKTLYWYETTIILVTSLLNFN